MKYILNNYYILRHDINRTFILGGRNGQYSSGINIDVDWQSMIHPAYAMMLSFFSQPIEFDEAVLKISEFFSLPEHQIKKFLSSMINAKECWHTSLGGFDSGFPKGLIIPANIQQTYHKRYQPEDFKFTALNFKSRRMMSAPLSIVWMPNNNCYTSCEYCYADRKHHSCMFSINKIKSFVKDAAASGVVEILLTGGDFFENYHWREILDVLKNEGYNIDMISTKKPLTAKDLIEFKDFGIRLQVSFDTTSASTAKRLLHVDSEYVGRIKSTLQIADELHIRFQVATVLTNMNDDLSNLEELYSFLSSLKHITHWEIRVGFRSLYSKADFNKIKSSRQQIEKVTNWINIKQKTAALRILWSPDDDDKYKKAKGGSQYFEGPICSANMTNMIVLPDGNVTICEQLYWNPEFIIGNVFSDSICNIWNSDKAINLWKRHQASIRSDSPCLKCKDFEDCFDNGNRCYANIIKAYGVEYSDYPDPRCFLAPTFKNDITHE
ncbi:MAG: radical SAM protein [Muribaculaceae bacterium]|nr:radical SAM protein [Muribaculaceae bacterium]